MDSSSLQAGGLELGAMAAEDVRLMTKVARLYHEQGVRQPEIAERLSISQPRVSRLLKKAVEVGIVRTTVVTPRGVYAELEERVENLFGLRELVVADTADLDDERTIAPALGAVGASYLETTLIGGERIGISSWSSMLLTTVESMRPRHGSVAEQVVQVLGGSGEASAQAHATRLTGRLAQLTGAAPVYLPAPGLVAASATRQALVDDGAIATALHACEQLSVLLAGIGSLTPSPLLQASGNAIGETEQAELRALGAVGDVCLRFFDAAGEPVRSSLDDRVVGIQAETLRRIPRRIGVAGGSRKHQAIRAALRGGWINVLITDNQTARYLAENPGWR